MLYECRSINISTHAVLVRTMGATESHCTTGDIYSVVELQLCVPVCEEALIEGLRLLVQVVQLKMHIHG